jgi:hypothetical protein
MPKLPIYEPRIIYFCDYTLVPFRILLKAKYKLNYCLNPQYYKDLTLDKQYHGMFRHKAKNCLDNSELVVGFYNINKELHIVNTMHDGIYFSYVDFRTDLRENLKYETCVIMPSFNAVLNSNWNKILPFYKEELCSILTR